MSEDFRQLIKGFCALAGLKDVERILKDGAVVINNVVFSLLCSEESSPGMVLIYCDFGDVPRGREADAYRALLKANMILYSGTGPAFTISLETGRVVFADHAKIVQITPEKLRDILVRLAAKAIEWRGNHFLQNEESSQQVALKKIPGWKHQGLAR